MALVLNDRVKETTTTTGTGTLTLGGAVTGFETFAAGIGNSNTTYYAVTLPGTAEFEVGLGTLSSDSSTIARTTIISSSNSDSAVNFSAGTKTIFCTIPASKSVFLDASGNATLGADLSVGDDLTILGGLIDLKSNSGSPSQIKFYCESSNAHAQTLTAQAHSVGATNTLTLPAGSNSTLVSESHTQTLTNKSLTAPTITGTAVMADLDISGDVDVDGTLEADAVTVNGTALNTVIAGVTVTNATNSAHVLVTDNESTDEENLITFVEDATSSTGNVGLEMDGNLTYNPSSGTVTATVFKGNIDAVDGDFDGTLEADAITLNGTAVTTTATLSTGISNGNVLVATSGIADNDFLRVDGTSIEGRSASEVLSDIGATTASAAADEATALAIALG
jgi:cytoskeletal protein CcmA (bactofilin family)